MSHSGFRRRASLENFVSEEHVPRSLGFRLEGLGFTYLREIGEGRQVSFQDYGDPSTPRSFKSWQLRALGLGIRDWDLLLGV